MNSLQAELPNRVQLWTPSDKFSFLHMLMLTRGVLVIRANVLYNFKASSITPLCQFVLAWMPTDVGCKLVIPSYLEG